jgi:hypothetical protein
MFFMKNLKKAAALMVMGCMVLSAAMAGPIGVTVGVDGLSFGDVAADLYDFAKAASISPFLQYNKALGSVGLEARLGVNLPFEQTGERLSAPLYLQADYGLAIGSAGKLNVAPRAEFVYLAGPLSSDAVMFGINVQLKYTQTLGFGSLYASFDPGFFMLSASDYSVISIGNTDGMNAAMSSAGVPGISVPANPWGDDRYDLRLGMAANAGVYGYVGFPFIFTQTVTSGGSSKVPDPVVLEAINIRLGYNKLLDGKLDLRCTFRIPIGNDVTTTYKSGIGGGYMPEVVSRMEKEGVTIAPRITYGSAASGLAAYLDFAIGGIGAAHGEISVTPSLGVSFAF